MVMASEDFLISTSTTSTCFSKKDVVIGLTKLKYVKDQLFPLFDEIQRDVRDVYDFFNDGTSCVNKSSSPTDNSTQQDTPPTINIHPTSEPTTPTNVHAEENNDNQAELHSFLYTVTANNAESPHRNIYRTHRGIVEPKNIKEAMADSAWIEAMQEELHQFDRLQVWELVDKPLAKRNQAKEVIGKNKKDETKTEIRNKSYSET
ncbi:hypothetical protein Tco_1403206 [Tanacetum coccineum]